MKESGGSLEVFFSDLTEEAQKQVLEFYGLTDPVEANLDLIPITIMEREEVEKNEYKDRIRNILNDVIQLNQCFPKGG